MGDCSFFPGFDLVTIKSNKVDKYCNNAYFIKVREIIEKSNAVIIFASRLPLYLDNKEFNDKKWNKIYKSNKKFKSIQSLLKKFKTIINKQ